LTNPVVVKASREILKDSARSITNDLHGAEVNSSLPSTSSGVTKSQHYNELKFNSTNFVQQYKGDGFSDNAQTGTGYLPMKRADLGYVPMKEGVQDAPSNPELQSVASSSNQHCEVNKTTDIDSSSCTTPLLSDPNGTTKAEFNHRPRTFSHASSISRDTVFPESSASTCTTAFTSPCDDTSLTSTQKKFEEI